jgi:adenine deaminase
MFRIPWTGGEARVIGVVPGQIVTDALVAEPPVRAGEALADTTQDLAKIAVVERHLGTGRAGLGFVRGFGLQRGAIASTVAHDAHNVVVVGRSGEDMHSAVARLAEIGGGQVAVLDGAVLAEVPLPLAGLMSDATAAEVAGQIAVLNRAAAERLGTTVDEPFMQLSFIALSVIPQLRLTDGGLVDVDAFAYVPVQVD